VTQDTQDSVVRDEMILPEEKPTELQLLIKMFSMDRQERIERDRERSERDQERSQKKIRNVWKEIREWILSWNTFLSLNPCGAPGSRFGGH
jgi:hypothetical protein